MWGNIVDKLIVEYDSNNGIALPDNKSQAFVENAINNKAISTYVMIGTQLLITLFCCAIVKGKIKHTEIEFLFKGKTIKIDRFGTCEKWPEGFGDIPTKALGVLLDYHTNYILSCM